MEKSNELNLKASKDEVCTEALNAVDLHEEFDEEDVYVGLVPLTFMNKDNISLVRTDVVPKQPFVCARSNQFYKYELFFQNTLNLAVGSQLDMFVLKLFCLVAQGSSNTGQLIYLYLFS